MTRKIRLIFILALLSLMVGCGKTQNDENEPQPENTIATLGYTPVFDYEVLPQKSSLVVDKVGYYPGDKKVTYILKDISSLEFKIIDVNTDKEVYEGQFSRIESEVGNQTGFYLGDFSSLSKAGRYRVFQKDLGYSEEFVVSNNVYDGSITDINARIIKHNFRTTSELSYTLANLFLTYEFYGKIFPNDAYVKYLVKLLLQEQMDSGAVYENMLSEREIKQNEEYIRNSVGLPPAGAGISLSATAEFAGVMAKYYSDFASNDTEFADECLRAALKAFGYTDQYRDNVSSDSYYYAASELYRATGNYKFRTAIALYDSLDESLRTCSDKDYTMLGDIAYLMTSYKTDYNRCDGLMSRYFDDVLKISDITDRQHFYVQADIEGLEMDDVLNNMMKLGLVSFIISGREYSSIQSNYLHYLLGANPDNINYLSQSVDGKEAMNQDIFLISKMLFVMNRE